MSSLLLVALAATLGQAPAEPKPPELVLDAAHPTSAITGLTFRTDGQRLYAVGTDKVVRAWDWDAKANRFTRTDLTLRVPVSPGRGGSLNAIAVSADGRWLATGGKGAFRGAAGFRDDSLLTPFAGLTEEMRQDLGSIYLFDLERGTLRTLRGHGGSVLSLAFVGNILISAGQEWDAANDQFAGGLRAWDVVADKALGSTGPLPKQPGRSAPGLIAWTNADKWQAAVAWDNGQLAFWNGAGAALATADDGALNNSLALDSTGQLLSGSIAANHGRLRTWATSGDAPVLVNTPAILFPPVDGSGQIPRGLALVASKPGGPIDHAVTALVVPGRKRIELAVVELATGEEKPGSRRPLWAFGNRALLTATPGGRHVAVAVPSDPRIGLFSVEDLLTGGEQPTQVLDAGGVEITSAGFVRRERQLGLSLTLAGEAKRLFDPTAGRVVPADNVWAEANAEAAGWAAIAKVGTINVTGPQGEALTVTLPKGAVAIGLAVRPPVPPDHPWPLVAVSFTDALNQPHLGLFVPDAQGGRQVMQYTGHLAESRALAFAADRPLLVSTSLDRTVCVWTLASLEKIVGQLGQLDGVAISDANGQVVVAAVEADTPAAGQLKVGDRVVGVSNGEGRPLAKPASTVEFYNRVKLHAPGQNVSLRVERGDQAVDLKIPTGQAIAERKPLFTLFLPDAEGEWLAWSPYGPYDSAGADGAGERSFGWHANPAGPGRSVEFVPSDQAVLRRQYRRPGIIAALLDQATLAAALPAWRQAHPRDPALGLRLQPIDPVLPRPDQQRLIAEVTAADFPAHEIAGLEWRIGTGNWQPMTAAGEGTWQADVPPEAWAKRGVYRLGVRLRSTDPDEPPFVVSLPTTYRPGLPTLTFPADWLAKEFGPEGIRPITRPDGQDSFPLRAVVAPFSAQVPVKLTVRHNGTEQPAESPLQLDLPLEPGRNLIVLTATNADAPADEVQAERVEQVFEIRSERKLPKPQASLAIAGRDVRPGEAVLVDRPDVRLVGVVRAAEALSELTLDGQAVPEFQAGKSSVIKLDLPLTLKPGGSTLRLKAATPNAPATETEIAVVFRPPLPRVDFAVPAGGSGTMTAARPGPTYPLKITLAATETAAQGVPITLSVRVNGKPQDAPTVPALGRDPHEFVVPVPLDVGANVVEVAAANRWHRTTIQEARVDVHAPPRIEEVSEPTVGLEPRTEFIARVRTLVERPLTGARLNGRPLPVDAIEYVGNAGGFDTWRVLARRVPLEKGINRFELVAVNDDGRSEARSLEIAYNPPQPIAKPEVRLLPAGDIVTDRPRQPLSVDVVSETPLEAVHVAVRGQVVKSFPAEAARAEEGRFLLRVSGLPIDLEDGVNPIEVTAYNGGGAQRASLVMTCRLPPVRIQFDRLEPVAGAEAYTPVPSRIGWEVPRVVPGRLRLQGRVIRPLSDAAKGTEAAKVRVWVNGFQQLPTDLSAPDANGGRMFETEIWLNQTGINRVEAELPDQIVAEVGGKRKTELLVLRCDQPIQGQRLHLLPVALNEAERPGLQERALKAIGAKRNGQGLFTAPGFEEVKVYGLNAATGVTLSALTEVLRYEIPQSIQLARRRPTARPLNDVVLIYYQGSEYVDPSGEFHLLTGQSLDFGPNPDGRPRFALPGSAVARAFARTPGAQVLVMDVSRTDARATPGRRHPRPANDRFGVMRSAWKTDDPPQRAALPADAPSVLGAMQSATATAGTLRELESRLRRVFGRLVLPGFLGFESDLPPELLDALSIGPPA